MDSFKYEPFLEDYSDCSTTGLEDRFSSNVSPTDYQELDNDWAVHFSIQEDDAEALEDNTILSLASSIQVTHEEGRTFLCSICKKNLVRVNSSLKSRRKRRRVDEGPFLSSMTICNECIELDNEQLRDMKYASDKSKRTVRRQQAKKRVAESEAIKKLQVSDEEMLEMSKDLPEMEKKKLQQMIRNRISAQQSRDRKKAHLAQIESENQALKLENANLKIKLNRVDSENRYLKNQLSRFYSSDSSNLPSGVKKSVLALGTVMCVVMLTQMIPTTTVTTSRILAETHTITYSSNELALTSDLIEPVDSNQYDITSIMKPLSDTSSDVILDIRTKRLESIQNTQNLRSSALGLANDPCNRQILKELKDAKSFATMYCPEVQSYWSEAASSDIQFIQMLVPLEALPSLSPVEDSRKYVVEMMCKVGELTLVS